MRRDSEHVTGINMHISSLVSSPLSLDQADVWRLDGHEEFAYSDGRESEIYLSEVYEACSDLGSTSTELESYIRDWVSEYHLSRKRAQLLSGFEFDSASRVLEVGCGCGAITRFLGETFGEVVSVEGNIHRARLARRRTKDLSHVNVICAPFQELEFKEKFDLIFCIGVFEYSPSFIGEKEPFESVLRYFRSLLSDRGVVVIAIENQFGLKYFNGCREDHVGVRYAGLEGYRGVSSVRTFGLTELQEKLSEHFGAVKCFYPYPDYKMPDAVVSHEFLVSPRCVELISQFKSSDYAGRAKWSWSEPLVTRELARNRILPFFAGSHLFFAGVNGLRSVQFPQLAVVYPQRRKAQYSSRTKIVGNVNGEIRVLKHGPVVESERLRRVPTESVWVDGETLSASVFLALMRPGVSLEQALKPCSVWLSSIRKAVTILDSGRQIVPGGLIDCIWGNALVSGGTCVFIDREWEWREPIGLNAVVIRAIYYFIRAVEEQSMVIQPLRHRSSRVTIHRIADALGVKLSDDDFREFIALEAGFQSEVFGVSESRHAFTIRWYLMDRKSKRLADAVLRLVMPKIRTVGRRIRSVG